MNKGGFYSVLSQRALAGRLTVVPGLREQFAHHHRNSSSPADVSCSSLLLKPSRCLPQSHPCDEPRPSPCSRGLCRPRVGCAGQARAPCTALAPLPEDPTCHRAPTHPVHADCRAEVLLLDVCAPAPSVQACTQHLPALLRRGAGGCTCEIPIPIHFSYKQAEWRFLSCQETKPVPCEQCINCLKSNPVCLALSLLSWLRMAPKAQHLAAQRHPPKQDNPQGLSKQKKIGERPGFRLTLQTHL